MNSFTGPSRWGLLDPLSRTIKAASNCGAAAAPCVLGSVAPAPADGMGTGISSPGSGLPNTPFEPSPSLYNQRCLHQQKPWLLKLQQLHHCRRRDGPIGVFRTNQCLKLLLCRVAMVPTAELGKPVLRLMLH
ncbi:unnamed protein product [Lampetra planeri]